MRVTQLYQDLTEVTGFWGYNRDGGDMDTVDKQIKTPAAICTVGYGYAENKKMLVKAGWTHIKSTSNWHSVHNGDKLIELYFKLFPENETKGKPNVNALEGTRRTWQDHQTLSGGCDIGCSSDWDRFCKMQYGNRYLYLQRVLRKTLTQKQARLLGANRFTHLFSTDVAHYFAPCFSPEQWKDKFDSSIQKEHAWYAKNFAKVFVVPPARKDDDDPATIKDVRENLPDLGGL